MIRRRLDERAFLTLRPTIMSAVDGRDEREATSAPSDLGSYSGGAEAAHRQRRSVGPGVAPIRLPEASRNARMVAARRAGSHVPETAAT